MNNPHAIKAESGRLSDKMEAEMNLLGRVALVTGGARGIGRAVALAFASMGADVSINYVRDERAAGEALRAIEAFGVRGLALRADVSQALEGSRLVSACVEHFGRLDYLVCNAGVWEGAALEEMSEEQWDRVIDINLKGTWAVCRGAAEQMKRQRSGRIVMISSTAGQRGEAGYSGYAAAKGGQISFMKSLAAELAPWSINVNAVAPGWVLTEMTEAVFQDAEQRRAIERTIPLGRVAKAEDVAWPVLFLCSDWAGHITGEVLNVNGGSVLCG